MFGDHGLGGLLEEGAHEKSPKCLGGNLGDFGELCKGLGLFQSFSWTEFTLRHLCYQQPLSMNFARESPKVSDYCLLLKRLALFIVDFKETSKFSKKSQLKIQISRNIKSIVYNNSHKN